MRCVVLAVYLAVLCLSVPASASPCRGNPHALGTSRVIAVTPGEHPRLGGLQYSQYPQLPLNDREVVITFDDGPQPQLTDSILKTLAAECVKATFFMIGRQASAHPELARRVHTAGHSVGTHSQNHPLTFDQMPLARAEAEVDDGIAAVSAALGGPDALAPFFRIPGLLRVAPVEDYLNARGIAVWSADFDAEDWYRTATPHDIVRKAMARLEHKGRGILLLHDVQPATALALPVLLRELKTRGYRVVHVTPRSERTHPVAERRKTRPPQVERVRYHRAPPGWQWSRR